MRDNFEGSGESYIFESGDLVLVKQRRIGKLRPKALGPFVFKRYVGIQSKSAEVQAGEKLIVVSTIHLCPYL